MSTTSKTSKATALAKLLALIAGTLKHNPNGQQTLGGVAYSSASLVALLQSLANAMTAQDTADANAKDALLAVRGVGADVRPVMAAYVKYLIVTCGNAAQTLGDYGIALPKARKPLTVEAKSAKVAQGLATREARGTIGPKKRLEIKGTVKANAEAPAPPAIVPAKPTA